MPFHPSLLFLLFSPQAFAVPDACDDPPSLLLPETLAEADAVFHGFRRANSVGTGMSWGDFNGDGILDLAIGAPGDNSAGTRSGAVYIFAGPVPVAGDINVTTADYTLTGPGTGSQAGYDVDFVGDIDSDGFDDILIGSLSAPSSSHPEGAAWLVRGSASPPALFDLATADATFLGPAAESSFGTEVNGVGDVTGDGLPDFVISAPEHTVNENKDGQAFLYDLGTYGGDVLTTEASVTFIGRTKQARMGFDVANVGDVNGDGFDDLALGSVQDEHVALRNGAAYVFLGGPGLTGPQNHASAHFSLLGQWTDRMGSAVAPAGDVNGDGLADFWIGAKNYGSSRRGAAMLVLGDADPLVDVRVIDIYSTRIRGSNAADLFGTSIYGNVDVNGDGHADVVVGSQNADGLTGAWTGAGWYVEGPFETEVVVGPPGAHWATHKSARGGEDVGIIPDLNGDGYPEMLVAAWRETHAGFRRTGVVAMFLGGADNEDEFDYYLDADADGWGDDAVSGTFCEGEEPPNYVKRGGDCNDADPAYHPYAIEDDCGDLNDYNCDGHVGAVDNDLDGFDACAGDCDDNDDAVLPGGDELCGDDIDNNCDTLVDDSTAIDALTYYPDGDGDTFGDATLGITACEVPPIFVTEPVTIGGDCDDSAPHINPLGTEVCDPADTDEDCDGVGDEPDALDAQPYYFDRDSDGFGDLYSLAYTCDPAPNQVTDGSDCDDTDANIHPSADEVCDFADNNCLGMFYRGGVENVSSTAELQIRGESNADLFGRALAIAEDINGDGLADVVIGAPGGDQEGEDAGAVYVYHGSATGGSVDLAQPKADASPRYGTRILHDRNAGKLGTSVASGDFNQDGISDLLVAAPNDKRPNFNQGSVYLFLGPLPQEVTVAEASATWTGTGVNAYFGDSVALTDLDGDGLDDVVIGARGDSSVGPSRGGVFIIYGNTAIPASDRIDMVAQAVLVGDADGDSIGRTLVVGDVNGDGEPDIIAGGPDAGALDTGVVDIFYGTGSRWSGTDTADEDVRLTGDLASEGLGRTLAIAGDLDGDGIDDLAIGTRYERVHLAFGGSLTSDGVRSVSTTSIQGTLDQNLGVALAGAGDLNLDGLDDLLIGASLDNTGGEDAGSMAILYGRTTFPEEIRYGDLKSMGRLDSGNFPTYSYLNNGGVHGASLYGTTNSSSFGRAVAGMIDLNGDGNLDLLVGEPGARGERGAVYGIYAGPYGLDKDPQDDDLTLQASYSNYVYDRDLDDHGDQNAGVFSACPMHVPIDFSDPSNPVIAALELPAATDDCDDTDPTIYAGAPEIPGDGIDQDCNGLDAQGLCEDDDFLEPNNTLGTAPPMGVGVSGNLDVCGDSDDYYRHTLSAGDVLTVTVTHDASQGDIDVAIEDVFGGAIKIADTTTDIEKVVYVASADTTVFSHVYMSPNAIAVGNTYSLDIAVAPSNGSCVDADSFEDNDTQGTAAATAPGSYPGLNACFGDLDYQAITLAPFETLTATVNLVHPEGDIDVSLHDGTGVILGRSFTLSNQERITYTSTSAETVYLRIYLCCGDPLNPGSDYDLDITVEPVVCDASDVYEDNDSFAAAASLGAGVYPGLELCPGDADWYALPMANNDTLDVRAFYDLNDGDVDLFLYDAAGVPLASSETGSDERITYVNQGSATTVHVEARLVGNDAGDPGTSYRLEASLNGVNPACTDADTLEPNNSYADAAIVTAGTYEDLETCMLEADFYRVDLVGGERLVVTTTFNNLEGDIDTTLLGSGGNLLDQSTTNTNQEVMEYTATTDESVFVRTLLCCGDPGDAGNDYTMQVDVITCTDADVFEPNDAILDAAALLAGTYDDVALCPTTEDVYSIDLLDGESVTIDVLFSQTEGNIDAELTLSDGTVLETADSMTNNETLIHTAAGDTTVFLHVFSDGIEAGDQGSTYSLEIDIAPPPVVCVDDDAFEDNDGRATAAVVTDGTYPDLLICHDDRDAFAVDLLAGEKVTFTAEHLGSGDRMSWADVYYSNLPNFSSRYYFSGNSDTSIVDFTATADSTITIMYTAFSTGTGMPWTLHVDVEPSILVDDDPYAPNDNPGDAPDLGDNGDTGGEVGDLTICGNADDWFAWQLDAGENLSVLITSDPADGDVNIELQDAAGNVLDESNEPNTSPEIVGYTATSAETVYARISLALDPGEPCADYDMFWAVAGPQPSCVDDDSFEPNDSTTQASTVTEGSYPALDLCTANDDWHEVSLNNGDTITATALSYFPEGLVDIELRDPLGITVLASSTIGSDRSTVTYTTTGAGVYLLRTFLPADPGVAGSLYTLDIDVELDPTAPPPCFDTDSSEPNDSIAEAHPLAEGTHTDRHLCDGFVDVYAVDVAAGDILNASAAFSAAEGNLDIELLDNLGVVLASNRGGGSPESTSELMELAGTYFVRVTQVSDAGSVPGTPYDISVSTSTPPPGCMDGDSLEPNNSWSTAATGPVGTTSGLRLCAGSNDWYSVALAAGETLDASIAFNHHEGDLDLSLLYNGAYVTHDNGVDDDAHSVRFTATAATTVYVRVKFGVGGDVGSALGNDYDLTIDVNSLCVDADAFEDNDLLGDATVPGPGFHQDLYACATDEDWYAVPMLVGEILVADFSFDHTLGDIDVYLYNQAGNPITSTTTYSDLARISYTATASETYHLKTVMKGADLGDPGNDYDLSVTVLPPPPVCYDEDIYEPNNSFASASAGIIGVATDLEICSGQRDFYAYPLAAGDTLTITTAFNNSEGDIDLYLRNVYGSRIAQSTGNGGSESITYTTSSAATVYLDVLLCCGDPGDLGQTYSLVASIEGCSDSDALEDNDDIASATPASNTTYPGLQLCVDDPDYFAVDLLEGERLSATMYYDTSEGHPYLRFLNATGGILASDTGGGSPRFLQRIAPADETVYVRAELPSDPGGPGDAYSMTFAVEPPCSDDDSYENNDDQASAAPLGTGFYTGLELCIADDDYFAVALGQGDTLDVDVIFDAAEGDVDLRVYNEAGGLLASATGGGNKTIQYFALTAETVYIRTNLASDGGLLGQLYSTTVSVTPAPPCNATDAWEDNDTLAQAPLVADLDQGGLIVCPTDDDWYQVDLLADDVLIVDLSWAANQGDLDLEITDAAGVPLVTSSNTGNSESAVLPALMAQTVYIHVYQVSDLGLPGVIYDLDSIALVAPNGACTDDIYENNDNLAGATAMLQGTTIQLRSCVGDRDWFSYPLLAGDKLTVNVLFSHLEADLEAALYDATGTQLVASSSNNDNEFLTWTAPAAQTVYLSTWIGGPDLITPGVSYTVDLSVTGPNNCIDDDFEDDDTFADATTRLEGAYHDYNICEGDDDWFNIYVRADEHLTVDVNLTHADGNINVELYDPAENLLDTSTSTTNAEQVTHLATEAGLYYARVYGTGLDVNDPGSRYDIDFTLVGGSVCAEDEGEPNDDTTNATVLVESEVTHFSHCEGGDDFFQVALLAGETIHATLTFDHAEGDIQLEILDENGVTRAASGTADDNENASWTTPTTQTVFIRSTLNGADTGAVGTVYDVTVVVDGPTSCFDDAMEDNDDMASSSTLVEGFFGNQRTCDSDEDWYQLVALAGETVTYQVDAFPASGNVRIEIYDEAGNLQDSDATASQTHTVSYNTVPGELVHLRVIPTDDIGIEGVEYDITVVTDGPSHCRNDDEEPNDILAAATPIDEDEYVNLEMCDGDVDVFSIPVLAGDTIVATVTFPHAEGNIDLEILDANGVVVDTSTTTTDDEQATYTSATAQLLYFRTTLVGADTGDLGVDYNIEAVISGPTGCIDDDNEPDNDNASATVIDEGTVYNNRMCTDTLDTFEVNLNPGETLTATLDFTHAEGNLQLALEDAGGATLDTSSTSGNSETVTTTSVAGGAYYLVVTRTGGDTGDIGQIYHLSTEIDGGTTAFGGSNGPGGCVDDTLEPNDNTSQAYVIDEGRIDDLTLCASNDYFRFLLQPYEVVNVSALFQHADRNLVLRLLNSSGSTLLTANTSTDNESFTYTNGSSARTYYALIYPSGTDGLDPGVTYSLVTDITGPDECVDDDQEDNDSTSQAPVIVEGTQRDRQLCGSDTDYYRMVIGARETVRIDATFQHADGNLVLELRNSSNSLLVSANTSNDNESITYTNTSSSDRTYYVRTYLTGADGLIPGLRYDLSVDLSGISYCVDDALEPNDNTSQAPVIEEGFYTGLQQCGSNDYYRFVLAPFETVQTNLYFSHADRNLVLRLLNSSGSTLLTANTSTDNESFTYTNASSSARTFYLLIYPSGTDGGLPGVDYEFETIIDGPSHCTDDDAEPNNNTTQATVIEEGRFESLSICSGNNDYFRFTLAGGETLTSTLEFAHADGNLTYRLLNSSGSELFTARTSNDNETIVYTNSSTSTRTYYLLVYMEGTDTGLPGVTYSIENVMAGPDYCRDDGYEPNDNTSQATVVDEGYYENIRFCTSNDYFRLQLDPFETIHTTIHFAHADRNLVLRLLNSSGSTLLTANTSTDNETFTYTNASSSARTFYILVYPSGSDGLAPGVDYDLEIDIEGADTFCVDDDYEPNNNTTQANLIDEGLYEGLRLCTSNDYFRMVLQPFETVTATIEHEYAERNLILALLNSGGSTLLTASTSSDDETFTYTNASSSARTFYILVYPSGSDSGEPGVDYDLIVSTQGPTNCVDDFFEPNDNTSQAESIISQTYFDLQMCHSNDYYRFTAGAGEEINASILFSHAERNLVLRLLNSSGSTLLTANTSTDNESFTYTNASSSARTFYILVYPSGSDGGNPGVNYDLVLDVGTPAPIVGCMDDPLENNDELLDASDLVDGELPGLQMCAGDDDWYATTVEVGETLIVDAVFFQSEGDIVMELVDIDGNQLEWSTGYPGMQSLSYTPTEDEEVFLRVFTGRGGTTYTGAGYMLDTQRVRAEDSGL